MRPGFEGGQLPIIKRLPEKRGFTNIFRIEYEAVNVGRLSVFEPVSEVTPEKLAETRLIRSLKKPVKILGGGELQKPLTVKASKFSESARQKIETAGGRAEGI